MADLFELYCEYLHCCGKKAIDLGKVESEKKAQQWCRDQSRLKRRPKLPESDLIKTCRVRHCPAKLQVPQYRYRKVMV